jgi:hypothetical protein
MGGAVTAAVFIVGGIIVRAAHASRHIAAPAPQFTIAVTFTVHT